MLEVVHWLCLSYPPACTRQPYVTALRCQSSVSQASHIVARISSSGFSVTAHVRPFPGGHCQMSLSLSPYPTLHLFCVQLKPDLCEDSQMMLRSCCFHIFSDTSFLVSFGHLAHWPVCLLRTETMVSPSLSHLTRPGLFCKNPSSTLVARIELWCCLLPILFLKRG